jgi:hypothetical protein
MWGFCRCQDYSGINLAEEVGLETGYNPPGYCGECLTDYTPSIVDADRMSLVAPFEAIRALEDFLPTSGSSATS